MKRLTLTLITVLTLTMAWLWVTDTDVAWTGESWAVDVWRYWGIPWAVVAFWSVVGYVVGKRLKIQDGVLACGVGVGVIGTMAWVLGLLGLLYMPLAYGIGAGVLVWGVGDFRKIRFDLNWLHPNLSGVFFDYNLIWLPLIGILWYIVRTLPMTCYPAVGWDECNSHLALPAIYAATHAVPITGVWWVNFSTFPQLSEMLTTLQAMWTDTPGAVWSYVFLMATCWVIFRWVKEIFISDFPALLAVLAFLTVPVVTMYSQQTIVDMQLTFFLTAGTWCLWRRDWSTGLMLLALACGTKYSGLAWSGLAILIFGGHYVLQNLLSEKRNMAGVNGEVCLLSVLETKGFKTMVKMDALILFAILGAMASYIRNLILFQDPFYPFGTPVSAGGVDPVAMLEPFRVHWSWDMLYRLTLSNQSPWDQTARPSDLGWWFPVAIVGGLFYGKPLYWLCLAFIGYWLLIAGVWEARYILPALPALTVCGVVGIWKLFSKQS